ncbi:L-dopachrome tautomerase-related protein [Aminipila luticellarii]|uniref:Major royal jelly protein n=1 Tax=Aminipila luticellarii TaxID=2507160 RepID=A0A410PTH3_9FIRM|nr:L-dopachrome tautomerase-related protein [Aminipila luticellarii]QAT42213.1 hypothetical protein EQM06_02635 [Aminipila luticellarii]
MKYHILLSWNRLDWNFPDANMKSEFEMNQYWKHAIPTGIKVDQNGIIYAAVPRWAEGIPATMNYITIENEKPILHAFPSWEWNQAGNIQVLQSVMGYEIDEHNRMWILDQGKIAYAPSEPGSQKLIIWDLNSNQMIDYITIPNEIAPYRTSFLNDIVVDNKNGFAYITDSGSGWPNHPVVGGIIIYDMKTKAFRRVLDQHYSTQDFPGFIFEIDYRPVYSDRPMKLGADGIALSADRSTLYYCPLTARNLYAVDTALLRDYNIPLEVISNAVQYLGSKGTTTDGMCADNKENVFYTMLEGKGIGFYHADTGQFHKLIAEDRMVWVDGVAFDQNGSILFNSNRLNQIFENPQTQIDWDYPYNFVLWKACINQNIKSYLYG